VLQHEVDDAVNLSSIIGQRYCVTKICPPARHGQPYHRTTPSYSSTPLHDSHETSLLEHPDSSEDIRAIGWYIRPQDVSFSVISDLHLGFPRRRDSTVRPGRKIDDHTACIPLDYTNVYIRAIAVGLCCRTTSICAPIISPPHLRPAST
jgi:hypothetical protein